MLHFQSIDRQHFVSIRYIVLGFGLAFLCSTLACNIARAEKDEFANFEEEIKKPAPKKKPQKTSTTTSDQSLPPTKSAPVKSEKSNGESKDFFDFGDGDTSSTSNPAPTTNPGPAANSNSAPSTPSSASKSAATPVALSSDSTVQQAQKMISAGDKIGAKKLLFSKIEALPREGMLLLLQICMQLKDYEDVKRVAGLMTARDSNDAEAMTMQGLALKAQYKYQDAIQVLIKATEANKKYERAWEELALAYEALTNKGKPTPNYPEIRVIYQDLIEINGAKAKYLNELCRVFTIEGNANDQAVTYCNQAIAKDKNKAENYIYKALAVQQSGEDEKAKTLFQDAAQKFPNNEAAQFSLAKYFQDKKNNLDAYVYFLNATKADAKSARSWAGLGSVAYLIQKPEVSFEAFNKACAIDGPSYAKNVREAAQFCSKNNMTSWGNKFWDLAARCARN